MLHLALLAVLSSGCATVLSGTRQDLAFTSEPTSSTVVLGGAPAEILAKLQSVTEAKDFVVRLLASALPDDARQFLEALSPDELLTMLVAVLHPTAAMANTVDALGAMYARTPQLVRDVVTRTIFVAGAGSTPMTVNLKKGSEYAAISWAPGHRAKLLVVETRFNFVSLLNVFTLGLGFVVDALTGAWFSLHPNELSWQLPPLEAAPSPR